MRLLYIVVTSEKEPQVDERKGGGGWLSGVLD